MVQPSVDRSDKFFGYSGIHFLEIILPCIVGLFIGLLVFVSPLVAVGVTALVMVVLISLAKPVFICYLVILSTAFTSGMTRGKLIPFLIPNEAVLVLAVAIALVVLVVAKRRQSTDMGGLLAAIVSLTLGTILIPGISYLLRGLKFTVDDLIVLFAPLQYFVVFWLFTYLPDNKAERTNILKLMLFCGVVVAGIGLLQALKVGPITSLLHNWYSSSHEAQAVRIGRITSLMSAWNGLGIFLMVNMFIAWAFGVSRSNELGNGFIALAMVICTAALVLSGSFAGMFSTVVGILIITVLLRGLNRRTVILLVGMAIVTVVTFLIFGALIDKRLQTQFGYGGMIPATLLDRFRIWQDIYLPSLKGHILWGVDLTIPNTFSWKYTESQYISLLFGFGLIGFIGFVLWVFVTLYWLYRRHVHEYLKSKDINPTTIAIVISIAVMVVMFMAGFTNAVFAYSGTAEYMWILLALSTQRVVEARA
jgi:hypothetical protein